MAAMPGHLKRSKALLAATPFLLAAFLVEMCSFGGRRRGLGVGGIAGVVFNAVCCCRAVARILLQCEC